MVMVVRIFLATGRARALSDIFIMPRSREAFEILAVQVLGNVNSLLCIVDDQLIQDDM